MVAASAFLQRQPRMLPQRMEVNLRKPFLREPHIVGAGAQEGQRVGGIVRHAQRVGVFEFAQLLWRIRGDPARARVLTAFQPDVAVVFGFQPVLHHLELQLADRAEQHVATGVGLEDLDGAFLAEFLQPLLQLLALERIAQPRDAEELG